MAHRGPMTDIPTTEAPIADNAVTERGHDTGAMPTTRVLRRCPHHRMVAGVAAGLADYLDVDPTAVRVALVLLTVLAGVGVPAYLAAWLLVPEEGADRSLAEDLAARWGRP